MTRSMKDAKGKKTLIKLDDDFFDTIFKCPHIDQYANIDMQLVAAYYDNNLDKCRKNINENWLKTPRPTIVRWSETIP